MTVPSAHLLIAAVALNAWALHASAAPVVEIPGTGVSMALPAAMQRGPIGTYFIESSGHTIVQIIAGKKENAAENGALFKEIYPLAPKQIEHGRMKARLYKRTRESNGGGWDGWSYNVLGEESALNVSVMYTGSDSEWFESFESALETLQWDERQLDSERSFQAHLSIPGLKMVPRQVGGLSFTADGSAGSNVPSLIVQVMPVTATQANQLFPKMCETALPQVIRTAEYSGPHRLASEGMTGCDGWGVADGGKMIYVAMLRTADGAAFSAIGNLARDDFETYQQSLRTALLQMQRLK